MNFRVGFKTDIGRKRTENQDNGTVYPERGLFVVADGMGGHRGGEIASKIAVESIRRYFENHASDSKAFNPREVLSHAILSANMNIFRESMENVELQGMGTTTTAILFHGEKLYIGHVGDSRCYLIQPGRIWQLTRDHSLVQEKLRAGLITRDELKTDRMKNVITRSVGFSPDLNVEMYVHEPEPGDVYLLCSDGLSGPLSDPQILEIVNQRLVLKNDPDATVSELIDRANTLGGDDNATAIVVRYES